MSYDLIIAVGYEQGEPVGTISTESILSLLEGHPNTHKDEYGLWEYDDGNIGFAISFDEDVPSNQDVMVFFPYSAPKPEVIYRLAAEFSLFMAKELGARVYDPQLGKYIDSDDINIGTKRCEEAFGQFERHIADLVDEQGKDKYIIIGQDTVVGPGHRQARLREMYRRGLRSRDKARFKIWHIILVVIIAMALMLVVRLIRTGSLGM